MGRPERNARIVRMVQAGKSYTEVAEKFSVSRSVVAGVCHRADVRMEPAAVAANRSEGRRRMWKRLRAEGRA